MSNMAVNRPMLWRAGGLVVPQGQLFDLDAHPGRTLWFRCLADLFFNNNYCLDTHSNIDARGRSTDGPRFYTPLVMCIDLHESLAMLTMLTYNPAEMSETFVTGTRSRRVRSESSASKMSSLPWQQAQTWRGNTMAHELRPCCSRHGCRLPGIPWSSALCLQTSTEYLRNGCPSRNHCSPGLSLWCRPLWRESVPSVRAMEYGVSYSSSSPSSSSLSSALFCRHWRQQHSHHNCYFHQQQ